MPQLDPTSFPSQLFWLTVTFVALYLILARFILPVIHDILEGRQSKLDSDLSQAAGMKEEAEAAKEAYELSLKDARQKAHDMIVASQALIQKETAERQATLDKDMNKKTMDAEAAIADARKQAEKQMGPVAAELAGLIVETLVRHKPDSKELGAAITEVAKEKSL